MNIFNDLQEEYRYHISINKHNYDKAKATMSREEFDNNFIEDNGLYYRLIKPDESDLSYIILDRINKNQEDINENLKSINNKIEFFRTITIIGIVVLSIVLILTLISGGKLF